MTYWAYAGERARVDQAMVRSDCDVHVGGARRAARVDNEVRVW